MTTQRGDEAEVAVPTEVVWFTRTEADVAADGDGVPPSGPAGAAVWVEPSWDAFAGLAPGPPEGGAHPAAPGELTVRVLPGVAADARGELALDVAAPFAAAEGPDAPGEPADHGAPAAAAADHGARADHADAAGGLADRGAPVAAAADHADAAGEPADHADVADRAEERPEPSGPGGPDGVLPAPPAGDGGGRHQWSADTEPPAERRDDGFDPSDTGTWKVREVVPGGESGRRTTTILQYLLGRLAVDHIRARTRWWYAIPVVGLLLAIVLPRWVAGIVVVLGVLLVLGRLGVLRLIERLSLARRFRPVEEDLRSAVEAGKANLRGELRRVGLPSGPWTIPVSLVRLARGNARSEARSRLLGIEIDRVLPRAQLDRALRLLDQAGQGR